MFSDYLALHLARIADAEKWQGGEDGFHFVFFRGGSGLLVLNSTSHRISHGDVLILNAERGGKIEADDSGELLFSHFSVRLENLYPLFSAAELSMLQSLATELGQFKLYPAGSALAVECQQLIGDAPSHFNLSHRSHLLRIAASVLSEEFKSLKRNRSAAASMEEHLVQVFERLSSHELLTLSAGELSTKCGCSRRHLSRIFREHFGYSIAALRMELRMLRAVTLLRNTRAKVINVAEQCGFNHLGLFNTCFRRRFGTSPGRWRALYAGSKDAPIDHDKNASECPFHANGLCPTLGLFNSGKAPASESLRLRNAVVSAALGTSGVTGASAGRLDIPPPGGAASPVSSGRAALNACA